MDSRPFTDVTGWWEVSTKFEHTSYKPFENLTVIYQIYFQQNGNEVIANGEKQFDQPAGRARQDTAHTPIHLDGIFKGRSLQATFEEEGARRKTTGDFLLTVSSDGNTLKGDFHSAGAGASGTVLATRMKSDPTH